MRVIPETFVALVTDLIDGFAVTGTGHVPGVTVHNGWPDMTANPPAVIVTTPMASQWLTAGQFAGAVVLHADVVCQVAKDLTQLETLVETALRYAADWGLSGVDPPTTAGLVREAIIHLNKQIKLD